MTALAEALLAAQRQAIVALGKAFVAGHLDGAALLESLDLIGCRDVTDQGQLLQALTVAQAYGAPAPNGAMPRPALLDEPASQPQLDLIARLAKEKNRPVNVGGLTKAQASAVITALQKGEEVPF